MWCLPGKGKGKGILKKEEFYGIKNYLMLIKVSFREKKYNDIFKRVFSSLANIYVLELDV